MKSREVISSQPGIHPDLRKVILKHSENEWKQPIRAHTGLAFERFNRLRETAGFDGFILDVGCGTGQGTLQLAQQYPQSLLVGIDQSEQRLGRGVLRAEQKTLLNSGSVRIGNCMLLRAEAADFWRLLSVEGLKPEKIFILYPNPWPKPGQLLRRWHAHPVFPTLMALGSPIELRSNWKIYLQEFAQGVALLTDEKPEVKLLPTAKFAGVYSTPFEKKYFESGHALWCLQT
ncbi:MAG: methyltransferase domain-containing protein [Xanthomonadales bacterium]|nr:methyltransferase domain-containing protein [Xanthomonadales bacterium]